MDAPGEETARWHDFKFDESWIERVRNKGEEDEVRYQNAVYERGKRKYHEEEESLFYKERGTCCKVWKYPQGIWSSVKH